MLAGHGAADPLLARGPLDESVRWLEQAGAKVERFVHPGGHGLAPDLGRHFADWLGRVLG